MTDAAALPAFFETELPAGTYMLGDYGALDGHESEWTDAAVGGVRTSTDEDGDVSILVDHYTPYHVHARHTPWGRFMVGASMMLVRIADEDAADARGYVDGLCINQPGFVAIVLDAPTTVRAEAATIRIGDVRVDLSTPQKLWIHVTDFEGPHAVVGSPVVLLEEGERLDLRDALRLGTGFMNQYMSTGIDERTVRKALASGAVPADAVDDLKAMLVLCDDECNAIQVCIREPEPLSPDVARVHAHRIAVAQGRRDFADALAEGVCRAA